MGIPGSAKCDLAVLNGFEGAWLERSGTMPLARVETRLQPQKALSKVGNHALGG